MGKDLTGWETPPGLPSHWIVRDGALVNETREGANIITKQRFQDLKLHVEFRLPKGGISGVFPRGRYWVVVKDNPDVDTPGRETSGAIHKFLVPSENANLGPDVWQTMDITLVGRWITVVVNGKTVIASQPIPGISRECHRQR